MSALPPDQTTAGDGFDEDLFADLPTTRVDEPVDDRWEPADPDPGSRPWRAGTAPSVEDLLRQAVDTVASARRAPLSASVLIARDDLLEMLQRALEALPGELRQARWLLREREEFLAQRQREADELIETVRAQAERMVQRTEIVRQADQAAQRIVAEARDEARRLRHEAEDFCDHKLAAFEVVLERTARTVRAGRERLASAPAPAMAEPASGTSRPAAPGTVEGTAPAVMVPSSDGEPLFDQDQP